MRWAVASCQDTTSLVTNHLKKKGLQILNYIDDFWVVAPSKVKVAAHFSTEPTLRQLGLDEAMHKASPPSQVMVWLGLQFDTNNMAITIPSAKLMVIAELVADWQC